MTRHLAFVATAGVCLAWSSISDAQVFGTRVEATSCASAIGGNVTASNVSVVCGIPPEVLDALVKSRTVTLEELVSAHRETVLLLKGSLDLNERQIRAALEAVGETNVPPERLAAKLVEIAERFKILLATSSAQPHDSPRILSLRAEAQRAIEAGELAKADALLSDVEMEQRRSLDRLAVNAAETLARRGDIALTRLQYGEAATHFANAAAVFLPNSAYKDKRIGYLTRKAGALFQQGERESGTARLEEAGAAFREVLREWTRERHPLDWATAQNNLGAVLQALGDRESGTAKLEEAVVAYREALKERTRARVPLDWARTQNNLGAVLQALGARESGTAKLEEAVTAFREALKERTRERMPLEWAETQNNLGVALQLLGEHGSGTAELEEAVTAHREALKEWTRERHPLDWATAQNNLGAVLQALGDRESGTAKLEEAVAAYREALKENTRERMPLDWATVQSNLGNTLTALGERESGTAKLEEAVTAHREALKEWTRERIPRQWAMIFGNEGFALMLLAERRGDATMAETALSQINAASQTMRDGGHAINAAYFERQLPRARAIVARLRGR